MLRPFIFSAILSLCGLIPPLSHAASLSLPQSGTQDEKRARGVLRAKQTAKLSAGMTGQILEAPYKAGRYVKSGDLLAQFDCTLETAEWEAQQKSYQTYSLKYDNMAELHKYGAAGEIEVALARSEMQQALAEANVLETRLKNCSVNAPFSGYVIKRHVSAFETIQQGQALYSLEKAGALELSVIVPSKWISWLKKGHELEFTVDETGQTVKAKVIRLGAAIDPVSQTIEIIASPQSSKALLSGMSGYARFTPLS